MWKETDLYLRNVAVSDMKMLFMWANDDEVRKNAFHSEKISYEQHELWFRKVLFDKNEHLFILMDKDEAVGQIRLSCEGETAEIDYSIDSCKRGRGYGQAICRLAVDKVKKEYSGIKILVAKVKPLNMASINCFQKNGFQEIYRQYELQVEHD